MEKSKTEKLVDSILPRYTNDPVGLLIELHTHNLTIVNADMFDVMGDLVGPAWDELWSEYEEEDDEVD